MDAAEAIAQRLLTSTFTTVVHEPDGNVPPDFLADHRVAVEVRRLNQHFDSGHGKQGLDEVAIPLWQHVAKLATSLGPSNGESWYISITFQRPVEPRKTLGKKIFAALKSFMSQAVRTNGTVYADDTFELEVFRAGKVWPTFFVMGGSSDLQSGGFVVAEMIANIEHCLAEKTRKIEGVRSKYPEWWLVLVDQIGWGLDDFSKEQLLSYVKRPPGWDKVVVVSPRAPHSWFEF